MISPRRLMAVAVLASLVGAHVAAATPAAPVPGYVPVTVERGVVDLRRQAPRLDDVRRPPPRVADAESALRIEQIATPTAAPAATAPRQAVRRSAKAWSGPSPAAALTFEPLAGGFGGWINDVHGAVGRSQVFSALNPGYRVHDRNGTQLAAWSPNAFWSAVADPAGFVFDPQAWYDAASGRYITTAVELRFNGDPDALLIGVSAGDDARAGWTQYRVVVQPELRWKVDRPTIGSSDTLIGITLQLFAPADPAAVPESGSRLLALRKSELLAAPATLPIRVFNLGQGALPYPALAVHDPAAAPSSTLPVLGQPDNDQMSVGVLEDVDGQLVYTPGPALAAPGLLIFTSKPLMAFQPGSAVRPLCAGVQVASVHRRRMYFAQHVYLDIGPHLVPSIRWGIVDLDTMQVVASELIEAAVHDTAYQCPSIAGDASRVVIGFLRSSPKEYVSAGYVVHRGGVTSAPRIYRAGTAAFTRTAGNDIGRLGDYSVTTFDPLNPCLAWTAQEHVVSGNDAVPVWAAIPLCAKRGSAGN